jgi:hypothetical protein
LSLRFWSSTSCPGAADESGHPGLSASAAASEPTESGCSSRAPWRRYVVLVVSEQIAWVVDGEAPIALMTRAGHRSMSTTKGYLHLAGVVFRDEADALERRLLGSPVESSTDLSEPQPT